MTGRLIADSEHMDHVTILLARVCAARLDTTIAAEDFVRMVARLVDVAVAEAIEDHDEQPRASKCVYCGTDVAPLERHDCERKRELGFGLVVAPRVNEQPATPAASRATTAPSQEGAGAATGVADSGTCELATFGKLNEQLDSTPAAGPLAGEQGLQSKNGRRMTDEQADTLRAAYDRVMQLHDGVLPYGWLSKQARALGFTQQSVSDRVKSWSREPAQPPKPDVIDEIRRDAAPRKHGNSHQCWCRKSPNSSANRWCSNAAPTKSPGTLAGLQESRPRRERELREVDA